ncbi:N-acetylmuramoyl-L-alanine amidase [Prosthecobacter sp.]|uniref:peptidoglycan recognition protein family protein n=1 Tax=Prosthecobacter sp. TaxID=1965333 RepID=UPI001D8D477B|nr:N-acetylmuramoyl-L-alanine amidase [Prosthecobacter sp.]MCB1276017.1 N-acetylmuramoyl-L-alanine amidase [Prosthecobacter sp.]
MNSSRMLLGGLGACLLASCAMMVPQHTPPGVTVDLIPNGRYARRYHRPMVPRYITIHATENYARSCGAYAHAQMLKKGSIKGRHNAIGYIGWHFTVDDHSIYQSMPTNERGEHADYDGPGNRTSIGIEMCENRGNSRERTLDKTARLVAWLMKEHGIPLSHVVPHQHWRMIRHDDHRDLGHKNCPHFLMDHGRPGAKWQAFLAKIAAYHRAM